MQNAETTLAIIRDRGKEGNLQTSSGIAARNHHRGNDRWPSSSEKTLVVCHHCHIAIHAGKPTRKRQMQEAIQ